MIFDPDNPRMRLALMFVAVMIIGLLVTMAYPWIRDRNTPPSNASATPAGRPAAPPDAVAATLQTLNASFDAGLATPSALRLAADFLEQAGDPRAVKIRARLAALQPEEPEYRRELMATARRFKERAIAPVDSSAPSLPEGSVAGDLREQILDALGKNDPGTARRLGAELGELPRASFRDRLLLAHAAMAAHRASLDDCVASLQTHALAHPGDRAAFAGWLIALGRIGRAQAWVDGLPAGDAGMDTLRADVLAAAGRWDEVRPLIARGAWGVISADALQLAFSARVVDRQTRSQLQQDLWNEALHASEDALPGLQILNRLAVTWGWSSETASTLLVVIRRYPAQTWAHAALLEHYRTARDTPNLKAILALWRETEPSRPDLEGLWTRLVLLTEPTALSTNAQAAAARLYATRPRETDNVTTFAFCLWQRGRAAEAVALMETLAAAERRRPDSALYHGLFLAGAGRRSEAREALALVDKNILLPEEAALLQTAEHASREPRPASVPAGHKRRPANEKLD